MILSLLPKWAIAGLAFPLIFLNGWLLYQTATLLQPITNIVVTASVVAFLLDYPARVLQKRNIPRGFAIALVLLAALLLFSFLLIYLGPIIFEQLNDFAARLPLWLEQAKIPLLLQNTPFFDNLPSNSQAIAENITGQVSSLLQATTSGTINIILSAINSTANLMITLVLSILLLISGDQLWTGILSWFPNNLKTQIEEVGPSSFQSYFSGQAALALILAIVQSFLFVLLKVPFGLLFGVVIGLASAIPFGGTISIIVISVLLAFQDIWLGLKVLFVALIIGQINENVLAPRLIGGITGLNPAVVLVALLIGAKLAGFLGLLLAVPTASFIKKVANDLRQGETSEQQSLPHQGTIDAVRLS